MVSLENIRVMGPTVLNFLTIAKHPRSHVSAHDVWQTSVSHTGSSRYIDESDFSKGVSTSTRGIVMRVLLIAFNLVHPQKDSRCGNICTYLFLGLLAVHSCWEPHPDMLSLQGVYKPHHQAPHMLYASSESTVWPSIPHQVQWGEDV